MRYIRVWYNRDDVQEAARLLEENGFQVIERDTYVDIVYDEKLHPQKDEKVLYDESGNIGIRDITEFHPDIVLYNISLIKDVRGKYLLNRELYPDLTVIVDGKPLNAHRVVLACASDYFRRILEESDDILYINDEEYYLFDKLLDLIYTGVDIHDEDLFAVLILSSKYGVKGVDYATALFNVDVIPENVEAFAQTISLIHPYKDYTGEVDDKVYEIKTYYPQLASKYDL